jgi:hypothetical protein
LHPAFATIEFGPFSSHYHREMVNDEFKELLNGLLEAELLPQVEMPYESTVGKLVATFNDQKFCGPHSAVRDIYTLEFAFRRNEGDDTVKADLIFDAKARTFAVRHNWPLYLWTVPRRQNYQMETEEIKSLCKRIARHEEAPAICPRCAAKLCVVDTPDLFDVRCPKHCFNYNYHRDPTTGEFLHGHYWQNNPAENVPGEP